MKTLIPLITPFDNKLRIDYNALTLLIRYLEEEQILVNSWVGEVYSLSTNEYIHILSKVKNIIDSEVTIYIPSYRYCIDELIEKIKHFYKESHINDNIMIELNANDWLCDSDLCLPRNLSKVLNVITSDKVMLYIAGQYNTGVLESLRGILRAYPEITHLVIDQQSPLSLIANTIKKLEDLDRKIELYVFGDYGFILNTSLIHGVISPTGLVSTIIRKKYNIDEIDMLYLTRITDYSYSIIGAVKTAINIIEPTIKEYVRPPIPTEFPDIRDHIESVLNYYLKE